MKFIPAYLILINLAAFILFGIDKFKATHNKWRIPEKHLFLVTVLGGSAGAEAGMLCFHHKTKHLRFTIGIPAILLCQAVLAFYLIYLR